MFNLFHVGTRVRNKSARRRGVASAIPVLVAVIVICSMLGGNFSIAAAAGSTYYVDNTVLCSDANPGTSQSAPWCTLTKAYSTAITAGDTVIVLHGTYLEQVVPHSGTAGSPITFKAGPGATVTVQGSGGSSSAFAMSGVSYVVIDGFNITETRGPGIYAQDSNHITISNNHVTYAGHNAGAESHQQGIKLKAVTYSTISGNTTDHNSCIGIRLVNGSNYNTISNNVSFGNDSTIAYPVVAVSDAAGIELDDSSNNTLSHNDVHGNEDSGINLYVGGLGTGSSNNIVVGNLSYGNGDHGIDNNTSPSNIIVGNTVQGNFTSGINLEAGSSGATIANNIVVNNGSNPGDRKGGNIYPDNTSLPASMDYNLYYQSSPTAQQINYNGTPYMTLAAFKTAIPAMEIHGLEADPHFVSPAAPTPASQAAYNVSGDYHLSGGSAAVDSANSSASNEPSTDLDGHDRIDDPGTPNTGAGTRGFDDRGAYEFQPGASTMPTVTTQAVTGIGQTGATGNGNVTYLGSTSVTQHGVAWGTSSDPTISGSHTSDGPVSATGAFTSSITGLTAGTLYHVRAYATNTGGTAYGSDVSFTTLSGSEVFTAPGTTSWIAPAGVTSITVEVWGGGGKGGPASGSYGKDEGGGGGGGAYSKLNSVTVVPGHSYSVVVGAGATGTPAGADSTFSDGASVLARAKGGNSSTTNTGASGGAATSGVGDLKYSGGNGASGSSGSNYGGGGGSSAGSAHDGATATNATGATAPAGGGNGGNGKSSSSGDGSAGSAPGGAGGGAYRSSGSSTYNGGNGANGQVVISYTVRTASTTTVACGAGTPSVTYGAGITCIATVTGGAGVTPTGAVAWTTGGAGAFATSPCTLSGSGASATCSVTYTPSAVGTGSHLITANYGGDTNYMISSGTQTATVNAKALSMSSLVVPASKVYDATTVAAVTGTPALLPSETFGAGTTADGKPYTGDEVSITGTPAGAYNSKDVATAANVTFSGLSLAGLQAGNYTLTIQSPAAATITAKPLTMSGLSAAASKTYNATTAAVVSGTPALAATEAPGAGTAVDGKPYTGDTVSITGTATGTYNSKDVATAASVTFGGLTLGGGQAGNYTLTMQSPAAATITAKALTMSGLSVPSSKVYNATTTAVVVGTPVPAAAEAPGAGTTSDGKPYTGDTVNITGTATGTYNSKDVATASSVTFSGLTLGGAQAGNYTLTIQSPAAATITAKALAIVGSTAANRVYDGTLVEPLGGTPALMAAEAPGAGNSTDGKPYTGDSVSATGTAAGVFANKNVGNNKPVTVSGVSLTGADLGNYTATQQTGLTANVTAKSITVNAVMNSKTYDGDTTAAAAPTNSAVASGDTANFTEAYLSKNVGTGNRTLIPSGSVSDGNSGNNYSYNFINFTSGTIDKRAITVTAASSTRVYDATTTSSGMPTITSGTLAGAETASWSQSFDNKNVGSGKVLTPAGAVNDTNSGHNYDVTFVPVSTGVITACSLTVTAVADDKTYDGTIAATVSLSTNALAGDVVTPSYGNAEFNTKDAGSARPVSVTGITIAGADAGNYNLLNLTASSAADIAKADAAIAVTPYSVVYDGLPHTATAIATGVLDEDLSTSLDLSGTTHTELGDYLTDSWLFTDVTGNYNNANGTVHDFIGIGLPAFTSDASSWNYGMVKKGITSAAKTFTITNTGTGVADLVFTTVALGGANPGQFHITADTCSGATVAIGSTCSVTATFKPTVTGLMAASLQFSDNASDSPQSIPLSGKGAAELALNGGFNTYPSATSKIPKNWVAASFAATDGKYTAAKKEGLASLKIANTSAVTKTLTQTRMLSGAAGSTFKLSVWAKAQNIPATAGLVRVQVQLYNGTKLVQTKLINLPNGTYGFTQKNLGFTASGAYNKVVIKLIYTKKSGAVWFDCLSLLRTP